MRTTRSNGRGVARRSDNGIAPPRTQPSSKQLSSWRLPEVVAGKGLTDFESLSVALRTEATRYEPATGGLATKGDRLLTQRRFFWALETVTGWLTQSASARVRRSSLRPIPGQLQAALRAALLLTTRFAMCKAVGAGERHAGCEAGNGRSVFRRPPTPADRQPQACSVAANSATWAIARSQSAPTSTTSHHSFRHARDQNHKGGQLTLRLLPSADIAPQHLPPKVGTKTAWTSAVVAMQTN